MIDAWITNIQNDKKVSFEIPSDHRRGHAESVDYSFREETLCFATSNSFTMLRTL